MRYLWIAGAALALAHASAPSAETGRSSLSANDYSADAAEFDRLIAENYAYLEDLPGMAPPRSPELDRRRTAVRDESTLLAYMGSVITGLADHHAITSSAFSDDWALVPTYTDLWIIRQGDDFVVDAVRADSPAEKAGIKAGDTLVAANGVPFAAAVTAFWQDLGLGQSQMRDDYAARLIAAGRRNADRRLTISSAGKVRDITLPSYYSLPQQEEAPVTVTRNRGEPVTIHFNNRLGDYETIAAFDRAMMQVSPTESVRIDLTDVPSGGNTTVLRGIVGRFIDRPVAYQRHDDPAELRATGVGRRWIEYVLPRGTRRHRGPVEVHVGRWTGSVGEAMAMAFMAIGAKVCGSGMAGLKGAVTDYKLSRSGLGFKLPTERLSATSGTPREKITPPRCGQNRTGR
ncbi:MAG: hypothetical protein J0M19_15170 [Sphingomonadales bacterium]|nr:hypothetical protein [Sphingomonadales bacterium]